MKIALVLDQFDNQNNGTTNSAARFAERLRARGHEVRIVAIGEPAPDKYVVPTADHGILDKLFYAHGMIFGVPDKEVLRQAFDGVDIVHLYLPFKLCRTARKIAKQMGVPHMAAFHCQPEHISYNIKMKYFKPLTFSLYHWFRRRFYRYIDDIHCPSQLLADQLKKHGYKSNLHVISNGVDEAFLPIEIEKPKEWRDKFVIMNVGRLSAEKRQDLIIRAAMRSKHRDKIQLVFLGQGPRLKMYKKLGRKMKNKPVFKYVGKEELVRLYNQSDLYIHAAEAEIEGLVCIEAISCGLVPLIAKAKMSASSQFALDARSTFKNKNVKELLDKIDYWIEHPKEKAAMRQSYLDKAGQYSLDSSIEQIESVYRRVIAAQNETAPDQIYSQELPLPPLDYRVDEEFSFINKNIFLRLGSMFLFYLITIISRLPLDFKIKGIKGKKTI